MIEELKHLDPATLALARLGALIYRDGLCNLGGAVDALAAVDGTEGVDERAGQLIASAVLKEQSDD
jgi:hypothetical protein